MKGTNMTHSLSPTEQAVFGADAVRHPLTDLVIEQGSGALPPDEQARRIHLPYIARTRGAAVAEALLIKLDAAARRLEIEKGQLTP
jgi:hypothetical protein